MNGKVLQNTFIGSAFFDTDSFLGTLKAYSTELSAAISSSQNLIPATHLNHTPTPLSPSTYDKETSGGYPPTPPPSDHSSAASTSCDYDNETGVVTFSVLAVPPPDLRRRKKGTGLTHEGGLLLIHRLFCSSLTHCRHDYAPHKSDIVLRWQAGHSTPRSIPPQHSPRS